ncbi:hypothetical protein BU251_02775 [Candidatus Velamenicoccus archaeovorus]|uniref:Uncharacterized protein n=1 Tax=Velamenicoccus archaeovorus TaxID=1930593 RepID=A0A410P3R5_VELA1|nr:hypothetical protein [Candidatus Velamenicoccus archaeovorus]QAT16731.1 hypothetical protein BU251_02775 [Candidatus Velamenicoccus archaeovorus]
MTNTDNPHMDNKDEVLEKKIRLDDSAYRFKRVLEILLEADLKRLQKLCQDEKAETSRKLKNIT